MIYFSAFVLAFFVAAVAVPFIRRLAHRNGWIDHADERKIHTGEIPRLGGIGIAAGFFASLALMAGIIAAFRLGDLPEAKILVIILGALAIHVLGLLDDFRNLRARVKFLVQLLVAVAVVAAGYGFHGIYLPGIGRLEFGIWGPLLSVLWIVGVANAINLIDGMDGLAGGISFIGFAVWGILLFKSGLHFEGMIAAAVGGAVLGFLFFNFPPASIFMGDSGSLLLGYMLAVIPLIGDGRTAGGMRIVPAITIVLIPILDTFAAMLRRWRRGVSFFTPDRYHVHHKLLALGFSPRSILVIVYGLCIILGGSALASVYASPSLGLGLMLAGWAVSGGIFGALHLLNKHGIRMPKREFPAPRRADREAM